MYFISFHITKIKELKMIILTLTSLVLNQFQHFNIQEK